MIKPVGADKLLPLYIYDDGEQIAWASEVKALLKVPGITAELDRAAMFDFLQFGYVPAPRTMFAGKEVDALRLRIPG